VIVPYAGRGLAPRGTANRLVAAAAVVAVLAGLLVAVVLVVSLAGGSDCATSPPVEAGRARASPAASLDGHPVAAAAAGADVVFVALRAWAAGDREGIEVLHRETDGLRSRTVIPLPSAPTGLTVSPDGRVLLAALDDGVAMLDTSRAADGDPTSVLGFVPTGAGAGTAQLAVAGGRYVLTADEAAGRVSVLDLLRMEAGDFGPSAQVATIDVDMGPAGLAVSPDDRFAYVVSQVRRPALSLVGGDLLYGVLTYVGLPRRAGTLSVIDVGRIERNPASAVIARVPAGCGPVRVAVSPDGRTVWVTARRSNELLAFRADQVRAGRARGPVARVPVEPAPQALRLVAGGRFALVAGSDRSEDARAAQAVDVVDTAAALAGRQAVRTSLTVGGMPHEIAVSADQRAAYVANSGTSTLSTLDLTGLPRV
jgi:DNA-binding beta-propeller fold protein YncE